MSQDYQLVIYVSLAACFVLVPGLYVVSDTCDRTMNQFSNMYYSGNNNYLSCDEMLGITKGIPSMKKCDSLTDYLERTKMKMCWNETLYCEGHIKDTMHMMDSQESECYQDPISCNASYPFRSADGSCNNLANPRWGQSNRIQNRLLPNAYDDGFGVPRTRGRKGNILPSPRYISNRVNQVRGSIKLEKKFSYMLMQWGQFSAHDIDLTPMSKKADSKTFACCSEDAGSPSCLPISIPMDDKHFTPGGCMTFSRSSARLDCNNIRQQLNIQTSAMDASQVYGPNLIKQMELREFVGGLLKTVDTKLAPDIDDTTCTLTRPMDNTYYCPATGDDRDAEQPGLTSIHTIFHREHNYLATELAKINPHWDDERLYQEARKIVAAEMQLITYGEYLPIILGPKTMKNFDLNIRKNGYKDTYDPNVDLTIMNVFSTAAYRFGHSQVHDNVGRMSNDPDIISEEKLSDHFLKPDLYHTKIGNQYGLEHISRWMMSIKCPFADGMLQESVRSELFKDAQGGSFDLAALNTQRGRDHGLPSYNDFREACGLKRATHFEPRRGGLIDHCRKVAKRLQQAYTCVDDIDIFIGGLTEKRTRGSVLGPTFQCLLAIQFKRIRDGDRFWFERDDPLIGFTPDQLSEIKKRRLASIICTNTDYGRIQREVFKFPDFTNTNSPNAESECGSADLQPIDLTFWTE